MASVGVQANILDIDDTYSLPMKTHIPGCFITSSIPKTTDMDMHDYIVPTATLLSSAILSSDSPSQSCLTLAQWTTRSSLS